jgi:Domain of Unknown Function (DUF1080)
MKTFGKTLVTAPMLVWLLASRGETRDASGTRRDDHDRADTTHASTLPLDTMDGLEMQSIKLDGVDPVTTQAEIATYRGRRALRVINTDGLTADGHPADAEAIAIVTTSDFADGTLEADVAARPRTGAPSATRGFVGIAFRVQDHGSRFESIFLRMTDGRADDQLQRNHATQYLEHPNFGWKRLREEHPGVYESYVDLDPGAWTRIKIVVAGTTARLYVNGANQPCLVVNDLKLGETHGRVALWTGGNTEAYFSRLTVGS